MNNRCMYDGTAFNEWGVCEECGNTWQKQEAAMRAGQVPAPQPAPHQPAPQANYSCTVCGAPIAPNGMCTNSGCPTLSGYGYINRGPSLLTTAWDYVRGFFSGNPMIAIENAAREMTHSWLIVGLLSCVLIALGFFGIMVYEPDGAVFGASGMNVASLLFVIVAAVMFPDMVEDMSASDGENIGELLTDNTALFFFILGIVVVMFFALTGIRQLFFVLNRANPGFTASLNVTAVSLLPAAVTSVAVFITSLFSPFIAVSLFMISNVMGYIYLYYGMQKTVRFASSPFWKFALLLFADILAVFLVCLIFFGIFC